MSVCVCVCMYVSVCECMCVCMCVCECMCSHLSVIVLSLSPVVKAVVLSSQPYLFSCGHSKTRSHCQDLESVVQAGM